MEILKKQGSSKVYWGEKNNGSILTSESGTFYIDENGIAQCFEPTGGNPFIEEEAEFNDNYIYTTHKSIRTMIIPIGVRGFISDFMHGIRVTEQWILILMVF